MRKSCLRIIFALPIYCAALCAQDADPNYAALRGAVPSGSWSVSNIVLKRDVGTFTLQRGTLSISAPILGRSTFATFVGEGTFHLTPVWPVEASHLKIVTGAAEFDEPFRSVVFAFTDGTAEELMAAAKQADAASSTGSAFQEFRNNVRRRSDEPRGHVEAVLGGEDASNIDAELLRELYTPGRESFSAYIHGNRHSDLRFIVNPSGAVPHLPSPEEVALIDPEPAAEHEGILYLSHLRTEFEKQTADSRENHRSVQAQKYKIDTTIGSNDHLTATCEIQMKILVEGTES